MLSLIMKMSLSQSKWSLATICFLIVIDFGNAAIRCGPVKNDITMSIVNGVPAQKGEFPWIVYLQIHSGYSDGFCGGSIVDRWHILTAAHCCQKHQPTGMRLVVGEYNRDIEEGTEQRPRIRRFHIHEGWNTQSLANDMCIIELADPIRYDRAGYVAPVCLPTPEMLGEKKRCVVAGWGLTKESKPAKILQKLVVPIIDDEDCAETYKSVRPTMPGMMCAGYLEGGRDSCAGDSGGPLQCEIRGVYYLFGATSWGKGCAEQGSPGVYSSTIYFHDWIASVLAQKGAGRIGTLSQKNPGRYNSTQSGGTEEEDSRNGDAGKGNEPHLQSGKQHYPQMPAPRSPKHPKLPKDPQMPEVETPDVPEVHGPHVPEKNLPDIPDQHQPHVNEPKSPNHPKVPNVKDPHQPSIHETHLPDIPETHLPHVKEPKSPHGPKTAEVHIPDLPEVNQPYEINVNGPKIPNQPEIPEVHGPHVPEVASPKDPNVPEVHHPNLPEVNSPKDTNVPEVHQPNLPEVNSPKDANVPDVHQPELPHVHSPNITEVHEPNLPHVNSPKDPSVPEMHQPNLPQVNSPKEPHNPEVHQPELPDVHQPNIPDVHSPKNPSIPDVHQPDLPHVNAPKEPSMPEVHQPHLPEVNQPHIPEIKEPHIHEQANKPQSTNQYKPPLPQPEVGHPDQTRKNKNYQAMVHDYVESVKKQVEDQFQEIGKQYGGESVHYASSLYPSFQYIETRY